MTILDDETVEPPEIFTISITATGPTQEFVDLFDITRPETDIVIIDNDSEWTVLARFVTNEGAFC